MTLNLAVQILCLRLAEYKSAQAWVGAALAVGERVG